MAAPTMTHTFPLNACPSRTLALIGTSQTIPEHQAVGIFKYSSLTLSLVWCPLVLTTSSSLKSTTKSSMRDGGPFHKLLKRTRTQPPELHNTNQHNYSIHSTSLNSRSIHLVAQSRFPRYATPWRTSFPATRRLPLEPSYLTPSRRIVTPPPRFPQSLESHGRSREAGRGW